MNSTVQLCLASLAGFAFLSGCSHGTYDSSANADSVQTHQSMSVQYPNDPAWVVDAAKLHGNMGPGVIAGAIVGHDAISKLGYPKPWEVQVTLYLPQDHQIPGYNCILDGLQSATGATMGKGNISLRTTPPNQDARPTIVIAAGAKSLVYKLNPGATSIIDRTTYPTMRDDSHQLLKMPRATVFTCSIPHETGE
jgi:hypothetical protein